MKNVLITGASSGIGKAFAQRFAKEGYQLILVSRRKEKLEELAEELKAAFKAESVVLPADLSKEDAAKEVFQEIKRQGLTVDVLVNNAGFATKGLLSETDFEKQHREINVNITALTELSYLAAKDMAQRKTGLIINIASAAAFNPVPYSAVYAATKAYVLSFTQSIAYEYRKRGIRVLAVCPQATRTHFFDEIAHMEGMMREPEDVVNSTFHALKGKKLICTDGKACYLQALMPHFLSRKAALGITGKVGEKVWG